MARIWLFLTTLVLITGCTTPLKQAHEHLELGRLEAAEQAYSQILKEDPKNDEAAQGLRATRTAIVEKEVSQSKALREAGKANEALTALLGAAKHYTRWKVEFSPAGKSAYNLEATESLTLLRAETQKDVAVELPLRAWRRLDRLRPIFDAGEDSEFLTLRAQISTAGANQCRGFLEKKILDRPALSRLISQFCKVFGAPAPALDTIVEQEENRYYRAIQCEINVETLPRDQVLRLGERFHKALERTAWFDPRGRRVLQVLVAGNYTDKEAKDAVPLSHRYREKGTGIEKDFYFNGWHLQQSLSVTFLGRTQLLGHPVQVGLSDRLETSGIQHFDHIAAIGLEPSQPKIPDAAEWANEHVDQLSQQFESKAKQLWIEKSCEEPRRLASWLEVGEAASRCTHRDLVNPPAWAEQWFTTHLGVGVSEALEILEKTD